MLNSALQGGAAGSALGYLVPRYRKDIIQHKETKIPICMFMRFYSAAIDARDIAPQSANHLCFPSLEVHKQHVTWGPDSEHLIGAGRRWR